MRRTKYWLVSDLHFYHDKMIELCGRPRNFEKLLFNSLTSIPEQDILICLGDVSWGKEKKFNTEVLQHIKCRKILVKGNHDRMSQIFYMNNGWDFCCDEFKLKYANNNIVFSHKPVFWDGSWDLNIHGHFHNIMGRDYEERQYPNFCKLIAMEYINYKPIELDKVLTKPSPIYK